MPIIRGYSANLDTEERITVDDLIRFIQQFEGHCVFVYRRHEVQLHGIRYSSHGKEVQFLMKEIKT